LLGKHWLPIAFLLTFMIFNDTWFGQALLSHALAGENGVRCAARHIADESLVSALDAPRDVSEDTPEYSLSLSPVGEPVSSIAALFLCWGLSLLRRIDGIALSEHRCRLERPPTPPSCLEFV
jgi:hypothetical protein